MKLQKISQSVFDTKYALEGEKEIEDSFERVAKALASVEKEDKEGWFMNFVWAMENGAIPAGRIMSNAGAGKHKPKTSTINCTVSQDIPDSMEGIMDTLHKAALTLKAGCGIGYCFSTLRPKGAKVSGSGASTSGPLSFMDIFDKMCFTISSAGGRRGAQMATFAIDHPDIYDFIRAKREDGRLRQFNLSCLITDDFMNAVKEDKDWDLKFDGKVYQTVKARNLFDCIMKSTYDYAEPGFILVDRINKQNNNYFCEHITSTNPCGEQPLPENGSCLLGSINLTKFVIDPFGDNPKFDWDKFKKVVRIFTRMLDNVVELNGLPLGEQQEEIIRKRRHGMGFFGLGSALTMMKMKYGEADSVEFTYEVAYMLAVEGWDTGVLLAQEKGMAPIFDEEFRTKDGWKDGKELLVESDYFYGLPDRIKDLVKKHGCRFTHHTSIAPTGTISLSYGNNASNGIEPTFAHHYKRNVIVEGKKTKQQEDVYSYEFLLYKELNPDADINNLPDYFITTDDLTPKQHIDIQAAAQQWVDSSISKTINVPTDISFEDFKDVYMYAYDEGLKGVTTFRYNPEAFSGVLVREEDLKNTDYIFNLDNGERIICKGDEEIEYEGEIHTAANLHDALKEGYYGKF